MDLQFLTKEFKDGVKTKIDDHEVFQISNGKNFLSVEVVEDHYQVINSANWNEKPLEFRIRLSVTGAVLLFLEQK
jgi:hypothetical protein